MDGHDKQRAISHRTNLCFLEKYFALGVLGVLSLGLGILHWFVRYANYGADFLQIWAVCASV